MVLKFDKVKILDWYDGIINAFGITTDETFYCSLLALHSDSDDKVYVCISLKFFKKKDEILEIIKSDTLKENWGKFNKLLNNVCLENKSYLIKTKNLQGAVLELVSLKDNFNWEGKILFGDSFKVLDEAEKTNDWWSYFTSGTDHPNHP